MDAITTPDGRRLEYFTGGDPDGHPLLFHVGTPMAAVPFASLDDAARDRRLRLIVYSRPGYGGSTPWPADAEPTMVDDAGDSAALLDALGHDRFVTAGWSGGGPRALACAAVLADRCRAAASLAGTAPYDADGLDFTAGMGEENVRDFELCVTDPDAFRAETEAAVPEYAALTADGVADSIATLLSPADAEALTPELADWVAASFRAAFQQGAAGSVDDNLQIVRPWGFALEEIGVPVAVWHGGVDRFVPYSHGRWIATVVPGARAHLDEGGGHLTLASRLDEILADLRDLAGLD